MTSVRVQPFCKKYYIIIGCFDGTRINPRNNTRRSISLFIYINHFCLIWKSNVVDFNQTVEKLKLKFKVIDNVTSDKHVKSFISFDYKP